MKCEIRTSQTYYTYNVGVDLTEMDPVDFRPEKPYLPTKVWFSFDASDRGIRIRVTPSGFLIKKNGEPGKQQVSEFFDFWPGRPHGMPDWLVDAFEVARKQYDFYRPAQLAPCPAFS